MREIKAGGGFDRLIEASAGAHSGFQPAAKMPTICAITRRDRHRGE
jgi:hypothetical protein